VLVDKSCNAAVLEDFAELRRAGVVHRLMDEIERVGGAGLTQPLLLRSPDFQRGQGRAATFRAKTTGNCGSFSEQNARA
jgi:hypothetical protein